MPSKRANHYGTAAERYVVRKYDLELSRASWKDAERSDGTPVEIKSCRHRHVDGQPGNFKIYEKYHRKLRQNDGWYAFLVYRLDGRMLDPIRSEMMHSSRLPRLSWHGGGEHRHTKQSKLEYHIIF